MKASMYGIMNETFVPGLSALSGVLEKGRQFALATGIEPDSLMDERLAPDMFPLSMQVQFACYQATSAVDRLSGGEPPAFEARSLSYDDAQALVEQTMGDLSSLNEQALSGCDEQRIEFVIQAPLRLKIDGFQLLCRWTLPNFYFHLTTAYDILRHKGVEIGKADFLRHVGEFIHQDA